MVKILTCNILNSEFECKLGYEWSMRKDYCISQIKEQNADVFGLQECSETQYNDFREAFSGYDSYGIESGQQGEGSKTEPIFFRRDLFTCIDKGGHLLDTETGYISNWVLLSEQSTDKKIYIINTHLIWGKSPDKRLTQLSRIIKTANDFTPRVPQILFGDMNCVQDSIELQTLSKEGWKDTYEEVHGLGRQPGTNHAFTSADKDSEHAKVDWILSKGEIKAVESKIIRDRKEGFPASDHYFVSVNCLY